MKNWKRDYSWIWSVIVIPAAIAILYFIGFRSCESLRCNELSDVTGRKTEFRFISGCYVDVGDKLIPRDAWHGEQEK